MTTDPRPLFAAFNRGVTRARRAYDADMKTTSDRTCRVEGCGRGLGTDHHARCWKCRKAGKR